MLSGLQASLIILIFLLIITQTVSICIRYDKKFIFDFNFTLISFTLIQKKKKNAKTQKRSPSLLVIVRTLKYPITKSHVIIKALPRISQGASAPIIYGYTEALRYALLALIEKNAAFVSYDLTASPYPLDLTFKISFYHLVCALVLYLREDHKSRQKARSRLLRATKAQKIK